MLMKKNSCSLNNLLFLVLIIIFVLLTIWALVYLISCIIFIIFLLLFMYYSLERETVMSNKNNLFCKIYCSFWRIINIKIYSSRILFLRTEWDVCMYLFVQCAKFMLERAHDFNASFIFSSKVCFFTHSCLLPFHAFLA